MLSTLFRSCQAQSVRTRPFLSTSIRRYASTPPPRKTPSAGSSTASRPAPSIVTARSRPTSANLNHLHQLRKLELAEQYYNSGKTLLYKASGRLRAYRIQCYALACTCLAGVFTNVLAKTTDVNELKRRGIPAYVSAIYVVIGAFLTGVGVWALLAARRQITTIRLIKNMDRVFLEVTATRMIPFLKHRVLVRPPDMLVTSRVTRMKKLPQWMLSRKLDESSPSATTASVLKNTAIAFSRFFFHIFSAARQFFLREGIVSTDFVRTDPKANTTIDRLDLDLGGLYLKDENDQELLFYLSTFKHGDK